MQTKPDTRHNAREAHLLDYWKIVWQGRYTILAIFLVVVGVSFLRVMLATPIYKATAIIEIKPEAKRILPGQEQWLGAGGGGWIAEEKYFNTQLEVIKSRDIAERTYKRLRLEKHPTFAKSLDPIGRFAALVEVRPKVETRLVMVSISGPRPKEVQEWVNTLAEVYVKRNVDEAAASFQGILDEIERGLATSRASLGAADTERLKLAADKELYVPENQQEVLRRNLQTYNEELARVRVRIGSLGSEIESLRKIREEGGDVSALPRVAQEPQIQALLTQKTEAERNLQRLLVEKRPQHPEVQAQQRDVDKTSEQLKDRLGRIAEKLETEYRLASETAQFLDRQIRQTNEQAYRVEQASTSYEMSKNDAESKKKVYETVAETMERLMMSNQLIALNNNVSILDRAIEPRAPVKPRKVLTLAFGCFLGLLLGLGAVVFLDYLDNTIRSPEDVEQNLGLGVLAIVPQVREGSANAAKEAYQSLRTSLMFSSHNRERRVILFSSAGPQEGKSSTAAAVARIMAASGDKVVLLDADLRRPTQHLHMKVPREPGITNYLLDGAPGEYAKYLSAVGDSPNLKVFTCGPIPPNPPEVIGSAKFRDLLVRLKGDFDWIVVDSPPIVSLSDTVVLASMADMVAIVIKHNENDRDLIRRCVKQLRDTNANIVGAVLNNVNIDRVYYKDYYYAGYYYYAEPGEKSSKRRSTHRRPKDEAGDSGQVAL